MWVTLYRAASGKLIVGMHLHPTQEKAEYVGKTRYPKAFIKAVKIDIVDEE